MRTSDVMTHDVISVTPETSIVNAIRLMLRNHVSGLPVIDHEGKLVGMLTESDFLRRPEIGTERRRSAWFDALFGPAESAGRYVRSHGVKVRDVMTGDPATVAENAPLDQVVRLMEARAVRHVATALLHATETGAIVTTAGGDDYGLRELDRVEERRGSIPSPACRQ